MTEDTKALGEPAACIVAIRICIEPEPVQALSHCYSFVEFKRAASAWHASLIDIAGRLVTVQPVRYPKSQSTRLTYGLHCTQPLACRKGCFPFIAPPSATGVKHNLPS